MGYKTTNFTCFHGKTANKGFCSVQIDLQNAVIIFVLCFATLQNKLATAVSGHPCEVRPVRTWTPMRPSDMCSQWETSSVPWGKETYEWVTSVMTLSRGLTGRFGWSCLLRAACLAVQNSPKRFFAGPPRACDRLTIIDRTFEMFSSIPSLHGLYTSKNNLFDANLCVHNFWITFFCSLYGFLWVKLFPS